MTKLGINVNNFFSYDKFQFSGHFFFKSVSKLLWRGQNSGMTRTVQEGKKRRFPCRSRERPAVVLGLGYEAGPSLIILGWGRVSLFALTAFCLICLISFIFVLLHLELLVLVEIWGKIGLKS